MSEQPQSIESPTGEDTGCQFPTGPTSVCGRAVARSGAPGRPGKYCDRDDHTRARAFAARREFERGTTPGRQQRSGKSVADRPVSDARTSFDALLGRFETLTAEHREQLGAILAEAAQLVATVGDADAAAYEVAEAHRAAEIGIAQAQTAQASAEQAAGAARRQATAALEAKAQGDAAAEEALAELDRIRAQTAQQLTEYQATTEHAQAEQQAARAELADVRAAAAQAITDAQHAAEASIHQVITKRDRIVADATSATTRAQAEKDAAERAAELDRATVTQLRTQLDTERAAHHRQLTEARREAHDERAALTRAHADQLTAVLATIGPAGSGHTTDTAPLPSTPTPGTQARRARGKEQA